MNQQQQFKGQSNQKRQHQDIPDHIEEALSIFQDDDYVIIKPALYNLAKQDFDRLSARKIMEKLQNTLDELHSDKNIKVLRVEFRTQIVDEDLSGKIIGDKKFNNYKANQFLVELLKDCMLSCDSNSQVDNKHNINDDDSSGGEMDISFSSQDNQQMENDITVIDASQKRVKINRFQEIHKIVTNLELALNSVSKLDIQVYNIEESSLDPRLDSPLTVTLRVQKKHVMVLNNYNFKINQNSERVYINFKNAQIIQDKLQTLDYSVKMGKLPIQLTNLTLSYSVGEFIKDISINEQSDGLINLFLNPYFKFSYLQTELLQVQAFMMFHCEESKLARKIEFILNVLDKFLLKIEVDLVNCQYCYAIADKDGKKMYFKLLCPPNYSISLNTKRKFELYNVKQDWIRVDNILSNAYYNKYKNEIERLIMINNTIITSQFTLKHGSREELIYKQVLDKLKQYNLLLPDEIDLKFEEIQNRGQEYDQLQESIKNSQLSFEQKYNIFCVISQNRITDITYLNSLTQKIIKYNQADEIDQKKRQKEKERRELVLESTFQAFSRYSTDLNLSVRQSELNKKNYLTFKRDLTKFDEDIIHSQNEDKEKRIAMIKRVSLTPSGFLYHIKLPEETSVIIRQYYAQLNNFIRLHFEDENLETIHGHYYITDYFFQSKLKSGMKLFNEEFRLLTWSASQLRGGSCWIFNYQKAQISRQQFIDSIGSFSTLNLDQIAKNAARLGQNFSSSKSIDLEQVNVKIGIEDKVGQNGKLFTDGIGKISKNLIKKLRRIMANDYISAIQIRFHGAKGVLLLNDELPDDTIELRNSMIKFKPSLMYNEQYSSVISLLDYNKFRGGYLNRQIIILLVSLGIEQDVFKTFQNDYLEKIKNLSAIDSSIYKHFLVDYNGELQGLTSIIDNIRLMINASLNEDNNLYIKRVLERLKRRGLIQLRTKCNILLEKAARVLGVVDDYNILDEQEVVCIVKEAQDVPHNWVQGEIIVVRNPCLHPGDIRKVRALSEEEILRRNNNKNPYTEYYNCIVFPCKGNSIPADCGGGDLDGDIYFVSWDPRIIPKNIVNPMNYDEEKKPVTGSNQVKPKGYICSEDFFQEKKMIDFLLQYLNFDVLGKIDNSHLAIADQAQDYANDIKCIRLAELHSAAVDYVKHGNKVDIPQDLIAKRWPDFMEKDGLTYESTSILGQLYRDVLKHINQEVQPVIAGFNQQGLPNIDSRFIYQFLPDEELTEVETKNINYQNYYQSDYQQYLTESICENALKCLNHIFENFESLRKMYDITNEYEIYTGYFTNFTQGEGTRLKRKLNVENVQKRVILSLVQLKDEITKILSTNYESRLAEISIMHFLMMYSPHSHENQLKKSPSLYHYKQELFHAFEKKKEISKLFSRLQIKFPLWYRGCSWYFFTKEIISFNQAKVNADEDELI